MKYNATDNPRFRSLNGKIRSMSEDAFRPHVTTTAARQMLNDLYLELCKYDADKAEEICKYRNA